MKLQNKIIILTIAKSVGLFLPIIILIIVNYSRWFKYSESSGYKVTAGFVIALIVGFLMAIQKMPKLHPIIWALVVALVVTLLEPLMKDIKVIAWTSFVGMILYSIIDVPTSYYVQVYICVL